METSKSSGHKRSVSAWGERTRFPRATGSGPGVRGVARPARAAAFSLIEVTMAVGIMGFAFVAILGMVPLGLNTFRDIKNIAVSSQVSQQIVAQVQVAPFNQLTQTNPSATTVTNAQGVASPSLRLPAPPESPISSTPYVRYFSEQGVEVLSTDPSGIYQVNTRVLVGPAFVQTAAAAMAGGVGNAGVAGVTVQVAYNPGRLTLDMDSHDPCLWSTTGKNAQVPIYHVETNVARNF